MQKDKFCCACTEFLPGVHDQPAAQLLPRAVNQGVVVIQLNLQELYYTDPETHHVLLFLVL